MIAFLRGQIISKNLNFIILETGNIGYQVFVSESFIGELKLNQTAEIFIHHHIREEANDLYGFRSLEELELFIALLGVSGIGPKSALGVLSIASVSDIKEAIVRGDADLLTKVSGVGKKTAERVVLELKNKVLRSVDHNGEIISQSLGTSDELEALMSLGYSLSEARGALSAIDPAITDSGERVKQALKKLAKR